MIGPSLTLKKLSIMVFVLFIRNFKFIYWKSAKFQEFREIFVKSSSAQDFLKFNLTYFVTKM